MNRNTAMIVTGVAAFFCGCPGLFFCLGGPISAILNVANTSGGPDIAPILIQGVGGLCGGIILIAIPVAIGFFTLRNQPTTPPQ